MGVQRADAAGGMVCCCGGSNPNPNPNTHPNPNPKSNSNPNPNPNPNPNHYPNPNHRSLLLLLTLVAVPRSGEDRGLGEAAVRYLVITPRARTAASARRRCAVALTPHPNPDTLA